MANIMLTDLCNHRCPYCFANEFVCENANHITKEAFLKAAEFILADGSHHSVGLIGGEPLLHPEFDDLLSALLEDKRAQKIMVYTNGAMIHEHANLLCHSKVRLLINCNSPEDIGKQAFARLEKNINILVNERHLRDRITLGVNMYNGSAGYAYMVDLLKLFGFDHMRVSITVPNLEITRNRDAYDYFMKMKPSVLSFFSSLLSSGIIPGFDCNVIPTCVLDDAEIIETLGHLDGGFVKKSYKRSDVGNSVVKCSPVIDILQDLTAVRCFGLSGSTREAISGFRSISDLRNYYIRTVDAYAFNVSYSDRCTDCYERKCLRCNGGCLAFKSDKMVEARSAVESIASQAVYHPSGDASLVGEPEK